MGFTYQKLKRVQKNSTVLEKQENLEIQQNCTGFSEKKSTLIRERFYREPKNSSKSSEHKKDTLKLEITKQRVDLPTAIKQGLVVQKDQKKFEKKVQDTSCQLANLAEDINHDIEILQGGNILFLDQTNEMEKTLNRKEKYQTKKQEKTWAQYLAHNSCKERKKGNFDIAKERFSLQHQCISTSPRYGDDVNLVPRPRMRSVGSQMTARIECLDQGAGDCKSVSNLNSQNKFIGKAVSMKCLQIDPTDGCYEMQQQSQPKRPSSVHRKVVRGTVCYPHNYRQAAGVDANSEYFYCQDEYFFDCPTCGVNTPYPCRCIAATTIPTSIRRHSTDLNTDYFFCSTDRSCSPPSQSDKKSKRKTKETISKCKESNEEYNEHKRKECGKHKEQTNQRQHRSKSKGGQDKSEKKSTKREILDEDEVHKILRNLDRYVDDREKELKLKATQILADSSTTSNATKVKSETKLCQVTLIKNCSNTQKELKGSCDELSLGSHYSLRTLHMLKKMKIREYKPAKTKPKEKMNKNEQKSEKKSEQKSEQKSSEETKQQEKLKKYQEYLEKYSKESKAKEQVQVLKEPVKVLKEPAKTFGERTSDEIDLYQHLTQNPKQYPILASSDEREIRVQNLQAPRPDTNGNSQKSGNEVFQELPQTLQKSPSYVEFDYHQAEGNRGVDSSGNDYGNYRQQYNNEQYYQDYHEDATDKGRTKRSIDYNETDNVKDKRYEEQKPRYYTDKFRDSLEERYGKEKPRYYTDKVSDYLEESYEKQNPRYTDKVRNSLEERYKEENARLNTDKVRDSFEGRYEKCEPRYYTDKIRDSLQQSKNEIYSYNVFEQRNQENTQPNNYSDQYRDSIQDREEICSYDKSGHGKSNFSESEYGNGNMIRRCEHTNSQQPTNYYADQVRDIVQRSRDETHSYKESTQRNSNCKENNGNGHRVKRSEYEKTQQPIRKEPTHYTDQVRGSVPQPQERLNCSENDGNGHRVKRSEHEKNNQQPIKTRPNEYVDQFRDSIQQSSDELYSYEKSSQRHSNFNECGCENDGNGHMLRRSEQEKSQQPIKTGHSDNADKFRDSIQQSNDEIHSYEKFRQERLNCSENNGNGHRVKRSDHEKTQKPIKTRPNEYVDQFRDSIQQSSDELHSYEKSSQRHSNFNESGRENDGNGHMLGRSEQEKSTQPIKTAPNDYVDQFRDSIQQSNVEIQQAIMTMPIDYVDPVRDSIQQSRPRNSNCSESGRENDGNGHMVEGYEHENDTNNGNYQTQNYSEYNGSKRNSLDENIEGNKNVLASEMEREPLPKREADQKANSKMSSYQKQIPTINDTQPKEIISPKLSDPSKTDNIEPSEAHISGNDQDVEKKSRTSSSYKDFKEVMDLSLGIYVNRSSQTENNLQSELNEQLSQQTIDLEKEPDEMPTTTEDALKYLKNFLSLYQQQSGMQQECLYSVTSAANSLIQKLSSCQHSTPDQVWTSQENFKEARNSLEDKLTTDTLEQKLTQVIQYDDPPDTSYSQLEQHLKGQVNEFEAKKDKDNFYSAQSYDPEMEHPVAMESSNQNLESNEYFEEELYQSPSGPDLDYWNKLEDYNRYHECRESLNSLAPPAEFSDGRPSQFDLNYDADYCDEHYTDGQYYYSDLNSSSRQPIFDPDLMPAKGILKTCRVVENPQEAFRELETYRTTSVVSFAQKEIINVQEGSSVISNQGQEMIEQHFDKEMETITTRDKFLSPLEEQSTVKLTETTIIHPIYQDCQLETELVPENDPNNTCNALCTKELPTFKQCPCMWETYVKLMQNY